MTLFRSAALAAILLASTPSFALAHHDVVHGGCPTGQSFTVGGVTVTGAFTRATPPSAKSAGGYFTISNTGTAPDVFTGATSEAAADISIHQMKMNGQVMEMSAVEGGLDIPPGGSVSLSPSGYHLMMTGMEQTFQEGECVNITLHFASAGDLPIQLNVGGMAQQTPPTGELTPSSMSSMDMGGMDMSSMSMN
jgi:copper(I)-binding protein